MGFSLKCCTTAGLTQGTGPQFTRKSGPQSRQAPATLSARGGACLNNLGAIGTFLSAIDLVYLFDGVLHFGPDALVFDWLVLQKLNRFNQTEFPYERRRLLANLVMERI